jgi:nucleoside-diphosphate-sugar epimerase
MRILITGANGYIGKSLHNALKDKYDVTAVTRSGFDLTDAVALSKFFESRQPFDTVLHCAASTNSKDMNWSIADINLTMYYNLLKFKQYYSKLIHFGSGAETHFPDTPYGYSKKVIAKSILHQDNFYNIKIFGVFDENELDTRFIKANIKRYINKEPIEIHEVKFMDFFYMQDLIKVVEYYINEKEPPKEFDCVYSKSSYTLFGLAILINKLDDYEVEVVYGNRNGDDYISKYRSELPIELIGLEQGIKNVYNKLK